MKILGIDPGKNTGFYCCSYDPSTKEFAHLHVSVTRSVQEALERIQTLGESLGPDDVFVVEDYVINAKNAKGPVYSHQHVNDSGDTLRVIGFAQSEAQRQKSKYHLQLATIKAPAYGFLGEKYVRGKKDQHAKDAKAHAIYYLVTKHGMSPMLGRSTPRTTVSPKASLPPKFHLEFDS